MKLVKLLGFALCIVTCTQVASGMTREQKKQALIAQAYKTCQDIITKTNNNPSSLSGDSNLHKILKYNPSGQTYEDQKSLSHAKSFIIELWNHSKKDLNQKGGRGLTPLMLVAINGERELTKQLLIYKADLTLKDVLGKTALDCATEQKKICSTDNNDYEGVIQLLKTTTAAGESTESKSETESDSDHE
jgi:ankyrin repeat protein